jgi:hypothetical protein
MKTPWSKAWMNKVYIPPSLTHIQPYILTHHTDQENLISTLSAKDTSSTRFYTALLSALPLAPAILHIPLLTNLRAFLPSLIAITSFLASAYTLYFLPLPPVKINIINTSDLKSKKAGGYGWNVPAQSDTPKSEQRPVPYVSDEVAQLVGKYIVPGNGVVCVLLAMLESWLGVVICRALC